MKLHCLPNFSVDEHTHTSKRGRRAQSYTWFSSSDHFDDGGVPVAREDIQAAFAKVDYIANNKL